VTAKPQGTNVFRDLPMDEKKMVDPDHKGEYNRPGGCTVCGANPCLRATEMCGPCTFGEADTADGNWGPSGVTVPWKPSCDC
jgi:hypothetical protein